MPMVVVIFEIGDDHAGLEETGPVIAVEALLPESVVERLDVSLFHGVPGGM